MPKAAAGHDAARFLQEMTTQMNAESRSPQQQQQQQQHPLSRRLGPSPSSSSSTPSGGTGRDRVNLGEYASTTSAVPLAAPKFSASPRRHRISGRIDEGWEEEETEEDASVTAAVAAASDKRLDAMMIDVQSRDSARKLQNKSQENDELSFVVRNLQVKLQEVEEECMRYSIALQGEIKEKRKLELRNADLSSKLADARQGLRDTQTALTNVQQATEQLVQKREQRDSQLQRVLTENKMYEARVYELETSQRNAENAVKTLTMNRDELIEKLQTQLGEAQETYFKAQSECVRHKGDKTMLEAELESTKRKLATVEMKSKQMENNLHATYTAEIDRLEERLRLFAEKVEEGRAQEGRANDLQAEIRVKMNDLKALEAKIMNSENLRKEQDIRQQSLETQLRSSELQHRQLDMRHRSLEQEFSRASQELSSLKRVKGQAEEEMREVALQNATLQSDKQELRQTINALESRLEGLSELNELSKRQKREIERANHQLDEAGRKIIDLERNHRILSDDCINTEGRIKGITQRMAALLARDGENRQIIIVANTRITELYNLARDLQTKYLNEELRADRLEKDFTGVVPKRPFASSTDVPYAAAPVVPLPMPMDSGMPSGNYVGGGGGGGSGDYSNSSAQFFGSQQLLTGSIGSPRSAPSTTALSPLQPHLAPAAFAASSEALRPTPPTNPRASSTRTSASQERPLSFKELFSAPAEVAPGTASTTESRGSTGASGYAGEGLGRDFEHAQDDEGGAIGGTLGEAQ